LCLVVVLLSGDGHDSEKTSKEKNEMAIHDVMKAGFGHLTPSTYLSLLYDGDRGHGGECGQESHA